MTVPFCLWDAIHCGLGEARACALADDRNPTAEEWIRFPAAAPKECSCKLETPPRGGRHEGVAPGRETF